MTDHLGQLGGRILDFDHIPIERHWGLSLLLHNALGHTGPWETCEAGCDHLASDAIRELFGEHTSRGRLDG